jgi:hypothetical protein
MCAVFAAGGGLDLHESAEGSVDFDVFSPDGNYIGGVI